MDTVRLEVGLVKYLLGMHTVYRYTLDSRRPLHAIKSLSHKSHKEDGRRISEIERKGSATPTPEARASM